MPRIGVLGRLRDLFGSSGRGSIAGRTGSRRQRPQRRHIRVESLEDRRLLSIQPVSAIGPTLAGDTAGGLNEGDWAWTSDGGRYVAFTSDAPNLIAGQIDARRHDLPSWNSDVFLRDKQLGTTTLVSRQFGTTTTTANGMSVAMGISANGRFVLFRSDATDLVAGQADANDQFDIFLYDRQLDQVQLVSHSNVGSSAAGDQASTAAVLSADGSFVAFASDATNVVAGQTDANNATDVFLWKQSTETITLVSGVGGSSTVTGSRGSQSPSIAEDGRSVAFVSEATDLVGGASDANGASDVFLFDYGARTNRLVSHQVDLPLTSAAGASKNPAISHDGLYVAYESLAGNVVADQSEGIVGADVFLFRRADGTNQLVSAAGGSGAATGNGPSTSPVVSADGRYVAFVSEAMNLVAGSDGNGGSDVFLFDRGDGISGSTVRLVSHFSGSTTIAANGMSGQPSLSTDGRWVAFSSQAGDLVSAQVEGNDGEDVFLYDRNTGTSQVVSVSRDSSAGIFFTGDNPSQFPVLSGDGSTVVYLADATDLVAGKRDDNLFPDLVLYDRNAASKNSFLTLRDPASAPVTGNNESSLMPGAGQAVASADGRFVVFSSKASNLVAGQVQVARDSVFLYDALLRTVQLVSHAFDAPAESGDDDSYAPTISADGRYVAFVSKASDLVQGQSDTNNQADVFLFDRITGTMRLVSHAAGSVTLTGRWPSGSPVISADGRFVAFVSAADNLVSGVTDLNDADDVFLYDLATESIRLVSASSTNANITANGGSSDPVISADGGRVVFLSQATDLAGGQAPGASVQDAFLFDRTGGTVEMVSRIRGSLAAAGNGLVRSAVLSADGRYVAFESEASDLIPGAPPDTNGASDVFLYRVADGELALASHADGSPLAAANGPSLSPALSADGRYLAFASYAANLVNGQVDTNLSTDIFLYDRLAGSSQLVSRASGSTVATGGGFCEAPSIGADGRFVAYNSMAGNLVGGMVDGNAPAHDVFRFDRMAGANQLVSRTDAPSPTTGDSSSLLPMISGDGRSVVFYSNASNLVPGDYNRKPDVFLFRAGGLVNQAPALDANVPTSLAAIEEDIAAEANPGTAIDTLVATPGLYADANGVPPAGIAVTSIDAASGAWQYTTDGVQWITFGAVSDTSATLLAADGLGRNRIRFQPDANYNGSASFGFRAWDTSDGRLNGAAGVNVRDNGAGAYSSQVGTANIAIRAVNDAPRAVDDPGYEILQQQALNVPAAQGVLANDPPDVEGSSLTVLKVSDPQHGTLVLNSDGSFTYTPVETFYGNDSFTYKTNDGSLDSNVATATIRVIPLNLPPIAVPHQYRTVKGRALQVAAQNGLLAGVTDPDGDPLTATVVGTPPAGLAANADGSFTFTPQPGYVGTVTFQYVANDGKVDSEAATVSIDVLQYDPDPVRRAPRTGAAFLLRRVMVNNVETIQLLNRRKILLSQPKDSLNSLKIVGAPNKNDTLTVVLGGASLPGGVIFDGGRGGRDTLVLRGTAGADTFKALPGGFELGGTSFQVIGTESVRFEGLGGNDTYAISALPRPLSIIDSAGVDALDFSGAAGRVVVHLASTAAQRVFGAGATLALKGRFENLIGTPYADKLTGNAAANQIFGGDGDDIIRGGAGNDLIIGEGGNDTLFGDAGNNVLIGGDGDDKLVAGRGRNVLIGAAGLDTLRGSSADDILVGGTTLYDASPQELLAILAEWSSTSRSAAQRVNNLTQGIDGPLGRRIDLARNSGAIDDSAADSLYGGPGSDWYLSFDQDIFADTPGPGDFR